MCVCISLDSDVTAAAIEGFMSEILVQRRIDCGRFLHHTSFAAFCSLRLEGKLQNDLQKATTSYTHRGIRLWFHNMLERNVLRLQIYIETCGIVKDIFVKEKDVDTPSTEIYCYIYLSYILTFTLLKI